MRGARLAGLLLGVALVAVIIVVATGRDPGSVRTPAADVGPGQAYRDQGDAHIPSSAPRPAYDSRPPTSGPHAVVPLPPDGTRLSTDQLLRALELGDVVLLYGHSHQAPVLRAIAQSIGGPATPALAAAGQAVLLDPAPGTRGVVAAAWGHLLVSSSPADPELQQFASFWLGHGATR